MKPRRISGTAERREQLTSASASPETLSSQQSAATTDSSNTRPTKTRRTVLTSNACLRCRQRKTKCDGKHPTCIRCHRDSAQCQYDVAREGLTKMQNLQQQLQARDLEMATTTRLLSMLQTSTDQHATELLARLRLGESVDDIVGRHGDTQEPSSSHVEDEQAGQSEAAERSPTWWSAPLSPLTDDMHASLQSDSNMTGTTFNGANRTSIEHKFWNDPLQSSSTMNIDSRLSSEYTLSAPLKPSTQQWPEHSHADHSSSQVSQTTRRASVYDQNPFQQTAGETKPNSGQARRVTDPAMLQIPTLLVTIPPVPPSVPAARRGMKPFWSGHSPLDAPGRDGSTHGDQRPRHQKPD